jgi:hypothetical protein
VEHTGWINQLHELLDYVDDETIRVLVIALLACIVRIVALKEKLKLSIIVRRAVVAIGVSLAAQKWLDAFGVGTIWRDPAVILVAFFADDIVSVLVDAGKRFRQDPKAFLRILKRLRKDD